MNNFTEELYQSLNPGENKMLVLTRKPGESIIIGNKTVTIKILDSSYNSVRLGIDAPKGLSIHREEVYNHIESGDNEDKAHTRTISQPIDLDNKGNK